MALVDERALQVRERVAESASVVRPTLLGEAVRLLLASQTQEACPWCGNIYGEHQPDCLCVAFLAKLGVRFPTSEEVIHLANQLHKATPGGYSSRDTVDEAWFREVLAERAE